MLRRDRGIKQCSTRGKQITVPMKIGQVDYKIRGMDRYTCICTVVDFAPGRAKYRAGPQPVHVFMIHSFTLA
jgi:hypothetical protein